MNGKERSWRRSGGLCAALAFAGWMGSCPAWAVFAGEEPGPAGAAGAGLTTVEALEARVEAVPNDHDEHSPVKPELRQIEAGFINLLESRPGEPRLLGDLADFYRLWGDVLETASPAALRLVTEAADPIQLAWRLHCRARELGADLLMAALTKQPDRPEIWLEAATYADNPAWKIVAYEEAARLLGRHKEQVAQWLAAAAAESALKLDVEYGQFERASAMLAGLPAAVRTEVESGSTGSIKSNFAGAVIEGDLEDLRLDLAMLHLVRGDMAGADRWLAAVKPGTPGGAPVRAVAPPAAGVAASPATAKGAAPEAKGGAQTNPDSMLYRILAAWRLAPGDAFEVLTQVVEIGGIRGERYLAPAAVARRGGYPVLEQRFNAQAMTYLQDLTPPAAERKLAPPGIAAAATALEAQIAKLAVRIEKDWERSINETSAVLGPDPLAPTVDRLLRAPLLTTFPEHPLPAGGAAPAPAAKVWRSGEAWLPPDLAERFLVVRGEQMGQQVVVIAKSLDFGSAAYWVVLSSDGRATWSKPLYAGVELARDYFVPEASNLPLLAGDHLHVEVGRQEPKPAVADPGDAGAATAKKPPAPPAQGIYLDIPIATLERDSDGDGLTDLAEERLITDPADPDTDHDGVPDGVDTLPQVAAQATPSPASRAMAALFKGMQWDERFGWQNSLDARTEYWIADRQLFTSLKLRTRIVVLPPEELDLAEQKLGPIWARYISFFAIDHAGKQAFAIWTSQVMGETYRLALQDDGTWLVNLVDSWNY
jgi:hypothetical protein